MTEKEMIKKAMTNEVHHNLFGGAKETLFNLVALHLGTFSPSKQTKKEMQIPQGSTDPVEVDTGVPLFSTLNECYGSGPTAGIKAGKCLDEGHGETISNLRTLMGHDKFFEKVTEFTSTHVASHTNWYGAGSFAKFNEGSSTSNDNDFGWGNLFMKTYFKAVTGHTGGSVASNILKSTITEGDWAFGLAFFTDKKVGLTKCKSFEVNVGLTFVDSVTEPGTCESNLDTLEAGETLLVLEESLVDLL